MPSDVILMLVVCSLFKPHATCVWGAADVKAPGGLHNKDVSRQYGHGGGGVHFCPSKRTWGTREDSFHLHKLSDRTSR